MIFMVATNKDVNDVIMQAKLAASFQGEYYEIGRGQWLVSFAGTARQLYETLSPGDNASPKAPQSSEGDQSKSAGPQLSGTIVFGIAGYFGRANRDMWEWMAVKLGGKVG